MIRKGTLVKLRGKNRPGFPFAKVNCISSGMVIGGCMLDRPLDGLRYWNVCELARAKLSKAQREKERKRS